MSMPPKSPASVALEDLLRLKRAERPDAAFWNEFERGLRQKQLAAIMEPRPWWLGLSLALRRPSVRAATLAVACVAVMAMLAPRLAGPGDAEAVATSEGVVRTVANAGIVVADARVAESPAGDPASTRVVRPVSIEKSDTPVLAAVVALAKSGELADAKSTDARDEAWRAKPEADVLASAIAQVAMVARGDFSPAMKRGDVSQVAVEGAVVAVAAPPVVTLTPGFEATVAEVGQPESGGLVFADSVEALVTDPRQRRLLAGVEEDARGSILGGHSLAAVRDHVLHHVLNNDELYASISRLGVSGDRLHLRF